MTPRKRFMAALNLQIPDRVPFADWVDAGIRKKLVKAMGAEEMDEAKFAKSIGFDAIGFQGFYDLAPVCDETKTDSNGRKHYLGRGLIKGEKDLDMMVFPDPKDEGLYDDAKRFIDKYGKEDLALYAGLRPGIQPTLLSLGWMGFAESICGDKKMILSIFDRYIEWNCGLVEKLQTMGFDFFFAYDDIAYKSGPMFAPEAYREIFLPRFGKLADTIKIPWAYHSDGDLSRLIDDLLPLGMNCINPIEPPCMNMKAMKDNYGNRVCLWGNIDLIYTLPTGAVEEVETEVKQRIKEAGPGGGYILGTANSITDFCKVENVLAMAEAVKKYGTYPINISDQ
jgi:uroporphyrinogen decarboxylase